MIPSSDFNKLKAEIADQFPQLSKRLKQVAEFALSNPNDMALETIAIIARKAEVQPSTLIRFAKFFGYDGFTEMQRIFKGRLASQSDYKARIKAFAPEGENPTGLYDDFFEGSISSLEELRNQLDPETLNQAIEQLKNADTVYLAGYRRAFPVAAYFQYAFSHLDKKVVLLHGLGGMLEEQARVMSQSDVLLAISFREHSEEVISLVKSAGEKEVPVIAVTDSGLGPIASKASICLEVKDAKVQGFRSLSATMCLALILVVGLGKESLE
ncbi:MurR/RpiR family transcriptional regulator [Endozoicomonas sp. OPT23]|uniref:MurR/RpiR family transcriptional regulator n=1 Tax=Endozoicomonas sp. OPT23 TaxID=2072845 RepID=UPI001E56CA52|nr:MurR/RpiR family transcriptional regulator [Endozoicomonas sp. OPT23]